MWNLLGLGSVFSGNRKSIFASRPVKPKGEETSQAKPTNPPSEKVVKAQDPKPVPAAKVKPPVVEGRKRSMEEFRSVFGHVEGTVLFLDGLSFESAAQTHIAKLNQTISEQLEVMEELKAVTEGLSTLVCVEAEDNCERDDSPEAKQERYIQKLDAKIRAATAVDPPQQ